MSNFIEQLIAMEEGRGGDAIILQSKNPGDNGAPKYLVADAIVQKINTAGGWQWCLRLLQISRHGPIAGSGMYGDLNDITRMVERQFGTKSDVREWVPVEYTDPNFPPNLIA